MASVRSDIIEIEGFKFRYQIEGKGPCALVIGSAVYYPRSFSKQLRKNFNLIFVDWRGFAESNSSENDNEISLDTLLDDIELIRLKLKIKSCLIIGHSAHALLALEYAKKYPKHISHVAMIGTSPNFSDKHSLEAQRNWQESVWPERKAALEEKIRQLPDKELAKLSPADRFIQWYIRRDPEAWYDFNFDSSPFWKGVHPNMRMFDFLYGNALKDIDISKGLEIFNKPVFLGLGRYDFIVAPPCSWNFLRPKFQNLTLRVFERSGHSPQFEEAPLFDEEILKWVYSSQQEF